MRNRLILISILLCGCSAFSQTTTITGTIDDLTVNPVTSGKVVFTLKPSVDTTISGNARFSPGQPVTCYIQSNGTLLNAAQLGACTVVMNTALTPAGTSYRVDICPSFACSSSFNFYAINSTYSISTIVPTPTTGPAQNFADVFSNQNIGGNKTFTGATQLNGGFAVVNALGGLTGPGAFTSTTQESNLLSSLVNGMNPTNMVYYPAAGCCSTMDAVAGGIVVPPGSTVSTVSGIAGYVQNNCDTGSGHFCNGVGLYGWAKAAADGAYVWGQNVIVNDDGTNHSGMGFIGEEVDMGTNSTAPAEYNGFVLIGGNVPNGFAMPAGAFGFNLQGPFQANGSIAPWPYGFIFSPGATALAALVLYPTCELGTGACSSQNIQVTSETAGNVLLNGGFNLDSSGNLVLLPATGGYVTATGGLNTGGTASLTSGAGVPSTVQPTCTVGSVYSNTIASSLSTLLYVCYPANTWTAVNVP